MKSQRKRITFKIAIPSVALRDLLQKAIFDETTHDALNKDAEVC